MKLEIILIAYFLLILKEKYNAKVKIFLIIFEQLLFCLISVCWQLRKVFQICLVYRLPKILINMNDINGFKKTQIFEIIIIFLVVI